VRCRQSGSRSGAATSRPTAPTFGEPAATAAWAAGGDRAAGSIPITAGNPDPFTHDGCPNDLFTVRADGTNLTQLTHLKAWDQWIGTPEWNEDGFLVSLIDDAEWYTIARVSVDGTETDELLDEDGPIPGAHPRAGVR
jgi:hypothetical protein